MGSTGLPIREALQQGRVGDQSAGGLVAGCLDSSSFGFRVDGDRGGFKGKETVHVR
jgi:hypothetical protein